MKKTETGEKRNLSRWKTTSFFRKDCHYEKKYFDVIDRKTKVSLGHLVDLTLTGLKIISRAELQRYVVYYLRIDLPKEVKGVKRIHADAECVWCQMDVDPEFYLAGFKILSITPPFAEIIETLIEQ